MLLLCCLLFLKSIYFFGKLPSYFYFECNTFPWSIPYSNMLLKHMIILPSDPDCSDLLMKTVCYQNVIMTGNSSLNGRKCSRKRLFNDFIQAYLINFCSLYIYKMDLFILLLLIMFICCLMAEVGMEARPEVGASPSLGSLWNGDTRLESMTGKLVPGYPGSLFSYSSLSLSLSWPNVLEVNCDTFSPSKRSPYWLLINSGLSLDWEHHHHLFIPYTWKLWML